ncbi:MAG TPA: hypothetical protein H9958_01180 [Candidatus Limosilactobacillus intestinavium]|nr:hypothetical protein [Candidatus Limosilactobacillus intestinavium]
MKNSDYNYLHKLPKIINRNHLFCAPYGEQTSFNGNGTLDTSEKFRVVQNRKGHRRNNNLTYILFYKQNNIMIRIDINGQRHEGVETPHVHIFDEEHSNGLEVIPLSKLPDYTPTDDIVQSLYEFLKYNNFDTKGLSISPSTA